MRRITVVEVNDITAYPPVQSLIKVLLAKGYCVNFIGNDIGEIPMDITGHKNYHGIEIGCKEGMGSFFKKVLTRFHLISRVRKLIEENVGKSDILWTTSLDTIRIVGGMALRYKNVLELLELVDHGYYFKHYFRIPLEKYARMSWKTVVPEVNRAYIQKTWWELPALPYVLPNKPYDLEYGELCEEVKMAHAIIKGEKRKVVLYLGGIYKDRDLETYANAIAKMEEYVLYIVGKSFIHDGDELINGLVKKFGAVYLGAFNPPQHLSLVEFAHIGLLPYVPVKSKTQSCLNALYCAPNKIFEYAGFGVPMVGSDVLGLRQPFEQWNIGRCCNGEDESSIMRAIEEVDSLHDEMSRNCHQYYDSIDLSEIIDEILEGEKK